MGGRVELGPGVLRCRVARGRRWKFQTEHRSTTDGRLCAAAFVHGRAAFTGCASVASPDGAVGREWCYVEDGAGGPSSEDWGFCASRIDYGDVRLRVANAYAEKSHEFGE